MNFQIKNICCIGAGYVGGPTMAVIAEKCPHLNINVVDINEERIAAWNSNDLGNLPIYEPGLKDIVFKCRGKNLFFSTNIEQNISTADIIFISVNTPTKVSGKGAGKASDLKWVEASTRQISKFAKGSTIVIEKSTLPVRTAETIKRILNSNKKINEKDDPDKHFSILSNPEFLSEGNAINDLENPDRILIGGEDEDAIESLKKIYLNWVDEKKILTTNLWSSELSKLIANAFLAQRVSSINAVSGLCEVTGANIQDIALAVGSDKRIGKHFLNSGPGFGGSCFKKDILNLVYICDHYGLKEVSAYWQEVLNINEWQQRRISNTILDTLFGTVSDKIITILGLAFKANTNDTRESPSIKICNDLLEEGAILNIYDPKVKEIDISKNLVKTSKSDSYNIFNESLNACKDSHAIVILTEWEEFKYLDWAKISKIMNQPSWIFDCRNIINTKEANAAGINTWCIGSGKFEV